MGQFANLFFAVLFISVLHYSLCMSPIRTRIQKETKLANEKIRALTQLIQAQFEELENRNFTFFRPVCYYAGSPWTQFHRWGNFYWIKVVHEDGIVHIKVRYTVHSIRGNHFADASIVEYRPANTLEEELPLF